MTGATERVIPTQRAAFDVPEAIAYFNTASLAPQLRVVRDAGAAALERRGRPWSISSSDWFTDVERLRSLFAQLIGGDRDGVAIVPATSYGFAIAARNLPLGPGRRVLVLAEEYPSGIYTGYQPGARRFDSGRRTKFELIPMAIAALERILAWQVPRIAATLSSTTASLAQRASGLGLEVARDHERGPHMLGLGLAEHTRAQASAALAQADCYAAFRGASLRVS
jgi:hypothetical protein